VPFKSKRQARWMFANKPALAKKWAKKYGGYKNKPETAKKKGRRR
jgi:hypothetical protein